MAEQDSRQALAEKIKNKVRKQIQELREQFELIKKENAESGLLLPEQLLIDPEYNQKI